MNSDQYNTLVRLARQGADYARAMNGAMVSEYIAALHGWWACAAYAWDWDTARTAQRAIKWVTCASDFHCGYAHPITKACASLMWGEAA